MSIIEDYSGLRDAWAKTHTYSAGNPLDDYAIQFQGKRFGYVLSRPPIHLSLSSRMQVLEPTQSDVVFTGRVPRKTHSFSDHFGG